MWEGDHPFRIHLFVDDGVLIEPDLATSSGEIPSAWEQGSFAVMGDDLNKDKLRAGRLWRSTRIISGYGANFDEFATTLPAGKYLERRCGFKHLDLRRGAGRSLFAISKNYGGIWPVGRETSVFGVSRMSM